MGQRWGPFAVMFFVCLFVHFCLAHRTKKNFFLGLKGRENHIQVKYAYDVRWHASNINVRWSFFLSHRCERVHLFMNKYKSNHSYFIVLSTTCDHRWTAASKMACGWEDNNISQHFFRPSTTRISLFKPNRNMNATSFSPPEMNLDNPEGHHPTTPFLLWWIFF